MKFCLRGKVKHEMALHWILFSSRGERNREPSRRKICLVMKLRLLVSFSVTCRCDSFCVLGNEPFAWRSYFIAGSQSCELDPP